MPCRRQLRTKHRQTGPHAPYSARDMPLAEIDAACEIQHQGTGAAVQQLHQAGDADQVDRSRQFRHRDGGAAGRPDRLQAAFDDEDVSMAHLSQPGGGHPGPYAGIVHQHDTSIAHTDPGIGCLYQLAARRILAAGAMPGPEFHRIAHIQDVQGAIGIVFVAGQVERADDADAGLFGKAFRALQR